VSKSTNGAQRRAQKVRAYQQEQKARRRRLVWLAALVGVLVLVGVIAGVLLTTGKDDQTARTDGIAVDDSKQVLPAPVTGTSTTQRAVQRVPNTTGVKGVLAWDTAGYPAPGEPSDGTVTHQHVPGPVRYAVTPPIGGPHNAIWMNAGVYTKPIPAERAVHNLEHGAVWITYDPDLPAAQVRQLVSFVDRQSLIPEEQATNIAGQQNRFIDLSPWPSNSLPSPIVISAWGYQLRVTDPGDSRLQQFVDTFRHSQKYTPEYGAAVDGIPTQTGGVAAVDGATKRNPPGQASSGM
jgi:hypothetical protein